MTTIAFEDVPVEAPHVTEEAPVEDHVSTPAQDESTAHGSNSAASHPFVYPSWMYTAHPSTQCQQTGKDCPALNHVAVAEFWASLGLVTAFGLSILFLLLLHRPKY